MLICSILAWAPPGADTRRHHHEERPADAWWVLRPFLVNFTMSASETARLLCWRQYACWKGFNEDSFRRELLASGLCLPLAAYAGIPVDELQERYYTTLHALPPRKNTLRAELHVTDVSRLNPVWCRLCQDQTPNKGLLEDEAGFWSIGLDWASQEEITVRRPTK